MAKLKAGEDLGQFFVGQTLVPSFKAVSAAA